MKIIKEPELKTFEISFHFTDNYFKGLLEFFFVKLFAITQKPKIEAHWTINNSFFYFFTKLYFSVRATFMSG